MSTNIVQLCGPFLKGERRQARVWKLLHYVSITLWKASSHDSSADSFYWLKHNENVKGSFLNKLELFDRYRMSLSPHPIPQLNLPCFFLLEIAFNRLYTFNIHIWGGLKSPHYSSSRGLKLILRYNQRLTRKHSIVHKSVHQFSGW